MPIHRVAPEQGLGKAAGGALLLRLNWGCIFFKAEAPQNLTTRLLTASGPCPVLHVLPTPAKPSVSLRFWSLCRFLTYPWEFTVDLSVQNTNGRALAIPLNCSVAMLRPDDRGNFHIKWPARVINVSHIIFSSHTAC